jgi:hypothetical protein
MRVAQGTRASTSDVPAMGGRTTGALAVGALSTVAVLCGTAVYALLGVVYLQTGFRILHPATCTTEQWFSADVQEPLLGAALALVALTLPAHFMTNSAQRHLKDDGANRDRTFAPRVVASIATATPVTVALALEIAAIATCR